MEYCPVDEILIREQYYLDLLKPYESGFNIGTKSCGGDNISNNPRKKEIVDKIKNTIRDNINIMTVEERCEKYGKYGELNPNYNNRWTDEMKEKQSQVQIVISQNGFSKNRKGKSNIEIYGEEKAKEMSDKLSEYAKSRTGEKNPFYNKKHSEKSKKIMSKSRIGVKPSNRILLSINGVIYESYYDAYKDLNIPVTTIRWRCLSNNPKFEEYKIL